MASLLTPVYFGEQTAMAGASSILISAMAAGEATAQLYLAAFIMDEARHFETLTRLYRALGHDPLGIRQIPELLRYHHRIRQGDGVDWVWGILFGGVIANHFYKSLRRHSVRTRSALRRPVKARGVPSVHRPRCSAAVYHDQRQRANRHSPAGPA
jgi:hypothetical protein